MRSARAISVCLLLLLAVPPLPAATKSLEKRIDELLAEPHLIRAFWGIEVVSLSSGKTLYSRNPEKLFTPASNTKLFTTAAALAMVGPEYRFRTTVETVGSVDRHGRLNGDLVLVGRGDPNLSGRALPYSLRTDRSLPPIRVLEELADQLAVRGVKYVDGDVVADDSYFAFERYPEGWTRDDLLWEWGAPVSALTVNDNVVFVNILPADRPGERAFVNVIPFADYYRLDNRLITTPAGTGPRRIYINREPGSNQLTLWGHVPVDDPGATQALAIENPADFAAKLFRRLLERRGIVVYGNTRTRHTELASLSTFKVTAVAPAGGGAVPNAGGGAAQNGEASGAVPLPATVLASYESQPLEQGIRVVNKVSQNLHSEILLRLLGREKGMSGSIEGGLEVMRGFLAEAGIQPDEFAFYDGSGLSRQNLITPRAILKLLTYAREQPWYAQFHETLPVAGVDGSLANRFRGTVAQGRVFAKTGSLGTVNALSGYVTTVKGEQIGFAIISNNHNLPSGRVLRTIDLIVEALVDDAKYPDRKEPKKKKKE